MQKFYGLYSIFYFVKILGSIFQRPKDARPLPQGTILSGLGTCRQEAFTQVFQLQEICVNEPSVQEGIVCRTKNKV